MRGAAVLLGLVLACLGLVVLQRGLRSTLRRDERYLLAFTAIDCAPPASLPREAFLEQVRTLADVPEQISILDDGLARQLAQAFARHPWVKRVEQVEVSPSRTVRVRLTYRRPVLAVESEGKVRAVDGGGVLLPADAVTKGLTRFSGTAFPPAGPAGTPWGDPAVEAAARQQDKHPQAVEAVRGDP